MHDFFVSYAHEERPRAQEVVRRLRELGQTVWLDEATDGDGDRLAGIPAGQRHRDVIEAGIDQAATFLVLDSPAWRRSTYCGQELDHAHAVGKRVAVLGHAGDERLGAVHVAAPADDPALVVRELAPGDEAARAHSRLHADMEGGGRRRSWWTTLLQPTDQTRDAELVTSQDPASTGLSVGPALAEFCGHLLDAARRRRRTIRSVLATGVTVLLVLAFLAVVGRQTTVDSRNHAAVAAARAVSLQLAQKALSASSTASGLELADQAVRSESTSAARSVQAQLRSRAQYLRYAGIRPGAYLSAAVSEDGDTAVLATVDSFVVADLTTGTSRVLPAPSTNRLQVARLAVAPDGARAYAVTQSGNLLCVDVPQRNIRMGAATEVADLSVAADGSLWWATSNGDVAHSAGCPGDASAERFRVPSTVTAFGVLPQGLAVLSADYVLSTYSLPPGPPDLTQQLDPRSAVPLESLPTESSRAWSVDPDEHGPDQVVVCGSTVHVAAQTNGTALFANWYAGFDDTGRPLGTRDAIGKTQGLACSSGGAAWAVPQLSTRPRALPDGAPYPVGVVDDQDAGSIVAVADSADHARTVVVHSSGRLDVLDPSAAPRGRTAGEATVAAPLSDGTVTVDDDGTVRMLTADSDSVLGRLDSPPPVNAVAALPDRVLVGSGSSVVELTAHGVGRSIVLPVPVTSLAVSADGSDVVAEGEGRWFTVPASLDGDVTPLSPPAVDSGEVIVSLERDGDRLVTGTTYGRLIVSTLDGEPLHTADIGVAGPMASSVLGQHNIVAMGQDGILRSYDGDLHLRRSVMFGAGGFVMRASADGRTLVLALTDFSVWAVDPVSLQVQQAIGVRSEDVRRILPSPDSARVVRVNPARHGTDSSTPATVETVPLRVDR